MKPQYHIQYLLLLLGFILLGKLSNAQCNQSKDFLQGHYDSTRADFSLDFFNPYSKECMGPENVKSKFKSFDCSSLWVGRAQEGVLNLNYWRIQVIILEAKKDKTDPYLYHIKGKTKQRDSITSFSGTIKVLEIRMNNQDPTEIDSNTHGFLYSEFQFEQTTKLNNTGIFKGTQSSFCQIDTIHKQIICDTTFGVGDDDYADDTFVGTWTKFNSTQPVKCIFGVGRLPYCFDFDKGDGDMAPNPRYSNNGWQGYPDDTWINAPQGTIPNKWWDKK